MTKLKETGPAKELRKRINWLEDQLHSLKIMNGVGYTARRLATGTTLQINIPKVQPSSDGVEIQRFVITEISQFSINGNKVNSSGDVISSQNYTIERPNETFLEHNLPDDANEGSVTSTDGDGEAQHRSFTITKTSPAKTFTVTQTVRPLYEVGQYIFGARPISGGVNSDSIDTIGWIDINVDARKWEWDYVVVAVCFNDITYHMLVKGSNYV